jgi:hypothetical protein
MSRSILLLLPVVAALADGPLRGDDDPVRTFDGVVAPLLARACLDCHSGPDPKGGLDLARQERVRAGGDSGLVITAGDADASLLWQRVRDGEMPPKHPLTDQERDVLRRWIAGGAKWGTDPIDPFRFTTDKRAGYDWWSLQPLTHPQVPRDGAGWCRNEIDRFVAERLHAAGLTPSPEADRRTLIRRLSFDLLGLPPSPEEVQAFVTDSRPDAYERLVDRLLASPHYGVRWGRHWLDVVRFGESQGFERDRLRDNAWPYRDWVIEALNADMPYDAFARQQIAGDVLPEAGRDGVIAAGFLVAGPWDEVGQNQQSATMKLFVRQDEMEDYIGVVGQTFLGLTVHCARCHDHKFDPISQAEYYRLSAALDGVHHGSRDVLPDDVRRRNEQVAQQIKETEQRLAALERLARDRIAADSHDGEKPREAPAPIARWTFNEDLRDDFGTLHGEAHGDARIEEGMLRLDGQSAYVATAPLPRDLTEKTLEAWVRVDALDSRGGGVVGVQTLDGSVFDTVVYGEKEPRQWMAGSDHFRRTERFAGDEEKTAVSRPMHVAIVYRADGRILGYRDGKPYGTAYQSSGPVTFEAGAAQVIFGIRHTPAGGNKLLAGRIDAAQLYDRALTATEIAASRKAGPAGPSQDELLAALSPEETQEWRDLRGAVTALSRELEQNRPLSVYTVQSKPPGGTHVLLRGSPLTPAEPVTPGGIASLRGVAADFSLPDGTDDAARRRALADWIASPDNPLFARVIVNRDWQFHFGAGLVEAPSDFGFNGGQPSHPELLDWLATRFLRDGQGLKSLHRLIVTSAAYRQSSRFNADAARIDAQNRLLWRMSPRRVDAEGLRDAILAVSGELNDELGGPGFRDFETFVRNTQFYTMLDPVGPAYQRRTIYRTWVRSARSSLLDAFDCPDPSTKTPQRAMTVTPLQALSLLNNSFVLRMSERFAERLTIECGNDAARQVATAFDLAYGRAPTSEETSESIEFITRHGLPEFCRVLFNSNEFLHVD